MPAGHTRDIAHEISSLIIERIEAGVPPWRRPWDVTGASGRPLRAKGEAYTGINSIYLWAVADACGYRSRFWMTKKQAQALGGNILPKEAPALSVFFSSGTKREQTSLYGDTSARTFRFMRSYLVYNCDQIEDLPDHYYPDPLRESEPTPSEHQTAIDAFFKPIPIDVRHGGNEAYYSPGGDYVQMPHKRSFHSSDHYVATLAHEMSHATGASHRLARKFGKRFGDKAYFAEELVAELSASAISAQLGLPSELHASHASYIDGWLALMKADKTAIITASAQAERAYRWLSAHSAKTTQAQSAEVAHAASLPAHS